MSKGELESLKNLRKHSYIIIKKPDKGDSIIILEKKIYLEKMNEMLDRNKQFLKLSIQEEKHYDFFINLEKNICEPLKELYQLGIIDKTTYDKLCYVGSHFINIHYPKMEFTFEKEQSKGFKVFQMLKLLEKTTLLVVFTLILIVTCRCIISSV